MPSSATEIGEKTALIDTGQRKKQDVERELATRRKAQAKAQKKAAKDARKKARKMAKQKVAEAKRHIGGGWAPWVLTLAFAAGAGFGGYYLWEKYQLTEDSLADSESELAAVQARAAEVDERNMALEAQLSRVRGDFAEANAEASAEAEAKVELEKERDQLATKLQSLITEDQGHVSEESGGKIRLQLLDKVLFRSGEAQLTKKGMKVLKAVGAALNDFPEKQVWVQGHTDNVPIANEQFGSNWELSAMRAINVIHFLQLDVGVDPRRLAAVAFSEYRPVSRKYKHKNRRIEIVLVPKDVQVAAQRAHRRSRSRNARR